jgi:adenylate cyclase
VAEQPLPRAYPTFARWRKYPWLRRRLELGPERRDFPALADFHAADATDYVCLAFKFGEADDPSHGTGVLYSFTTDRPGGFHQAEIQFLRSTLPGLALAMKAHTGYDIALGLLRTYLGDDAGSRVHSGAVERGTVDSLHSVLWYADLRGFTRISHVSSGTEIVQMLNDVFETLTTSLRPRGGHVLKFIGDAMLATISFDEPDERAPCRRALDAAVEASANVKARNLERDAAGLPFADVDIALHVGEVLYGNVGAADRLDFTVTGPAVNEVVRIEKLCEPLSRQILFSSRFGRPAHGFSRRCRGIRLLCCAHSLAHDSPLMESQYSSLLHQAADGRGFRAGVPAHRSRPRRAKAQRLQKREESSYP